MWLGSTQMKLNNDKRYRHTTDTSGRHASLHSQTQAVRFKRAAIRAMRSRVILGAISTVMLASLGQAAVFYVDVGSGSDSNNGTSQGTAWAHLPGTVGFSGSAWATLQNGDTVYVKGGTVNNVQVKFTSSSYNGNNAFDSIKVVSGHLAGTTWGSGRAI